MTVAEMLDRISSAELTEWLGMYAEEDAAWVAAHPEAVPKTTADGQPLTTPDGRPLNMRGTG
jgi:hypothetical protein